MNWNQVKLLLFLFFPLTGLASPVQVVQTVPVETNLSVPGIPDTQKIWLEMISSAKKTIDLEQFYIHHQPGQSLQPVLSALIAAAGRGVQIRFIVDIKFYKNYPDVPNLLSKTKNVQVKTIDYSKFGGIQHAKFFIVDQFRSFVGSANFDWLALSHIHEVGLQIADSQISFNLGEVFNQDWAMGTLLGAKPLSLVKSKNANGGGVSGKNTAIRLVGSPTTFLPKVVTPSLTAVTGLLASAQKEIKIQLYQYSVKAAKGVWLLLDNELRKAAARGVQVKLMVDAVALKNSAAELKALAGTKNIQVKAVTIPQWSGGPLQYARLIHSKYFTVDGISSWVGTENWSENYFSGCRNVGLILQSPETTVQLDLIYDRVWSSAYAASL